VPGGQIHVFGARAANNVASDLSNAEVEIQLMLWAGNKPDAIRERRRNVQSWEVQGMVWRLRKFRTENDCALGWPLEDECDRVKRARLPIGCVATHPPEFGIGAANAKV
jgi:hypothetical protein